MPEDLKQKIEALVALYEGEKQRADSLSEALSKSEEAVSACRQQITELTRQTDSLKLALALQGGSSPQSGVEARERIDKLLKEVDRCIRLLGE